MNEQIMPRVITQTVFQLQKDVIKTACKQCHAAFNLPSVSTDRYLLQKWSLETSILRNIRLYTHYILPVLII